MFPLPKVNAQSYKLGKEEEHEILSEKKESTFPDKIKSSFSLHAPDEGENLLDGLSLLLHKLRFLCVERKREI